jgi:hypothetical protein
MEAGGELHTATALGSVRSFDNHRTSSWVDTAAGRNALVNSKIPFGIELQLLNRQICSLVPLLVCDLMTVSTVEKM